VKRLSLALAALLTGCATPPQTYRTEKPELDLARYFDGKVQASGMFQDRFGKVVQRFTVDIEGHWNGAVGTLDERFLYSDGTRERRVWTVTRTAEHEYRGTAADVVGEARGEAWGNALNWRYTLRLKVGANTWDMQFDDWMFMIDDRVMLNRATMSKFGIELGQVTIAFHKL
jgi:starvation-inducible outer membrane lipoprotein